MRTPEEMGKIIRQLRGGYSLREFAQKCDISHTTLDYIEKGYDFRTGKAAHPSAMVLAKIAKAAKVPLHYIIGESSPQKVSPAEEHALSDGEKAMIDLFRSASPYQQEMILRMLEAAVIPKE